MKTVAFDCKGTLFAGGETGNRVHALYKWFESKGCKMIIWSSLYSYTTDAVKLFKLNGEQRHKEPFSFDEEFLKHNPDYNVDIAVDDNAWVMRSEKIQPTVACNHMIKVHQIPAPEHFEETYSHLLLEGEANVS